MRHDILKEVIFDQHEVIRRAEIVEREYDFDPSANYILVGLRRAGKTTLLYKIVRDLIASAVSWDQIIYINFEDERLSDFSTDDFNDILAVQAELSDQRGYFFLDEVQNIPAWEKFARRMADYKEHTFITGSNSQMLSSEMASTLGGRYLIKLVYPYNFREFLKASEVPYDRNTVLQTKGQAAIRRAFDRFISWGGFPETLGYIEKREYITSLYQKILLGDIVSRNKIRNPEVLRVMMKKLAESVKDEISFSRLQGILGEIGMKTSKDSLIEYISYAEEAFLLFPVKNFASKFAQRESSPKYYFSDSGILRLFLSKNDTALIENLVAIRMRQLYEDKLYYLKSERNHIDIDFYIPEEGMAVQVAYSLSNTANSREIDNLVRLASKDSSISKFIILTYEEEKTMKEGDIIIQSLPLWKWLIRN